MTLINAYAVIDASLQKSLMPTDSIVSSMQRILEAMGYRVTARTSSIEALAAFEAKQDEIDLVITDQTMPKMTGDQLARRILELRPEMPIILCTGYSTVINDAKAKAMGIRRFLLKPIIKQELAEILRELLDPAGKNPPAPSSPSQ